MRGKRYKKADSKNPEIQVSFKEQNEKRQVDESKLNIEMMRVHSTQKQRIMNEIWSMSQEEMCKFFTSYKLFPHEIFKIKQLLDSKSLKLIKSKDKIYFGQVQRKKRTGMGIYVTRQGKLYEGYFKQNQRHGKGAQVYQNGNLYIGEFQNNKKHAQGKFFWFSLNAKSKMATQLYEGEWWGGLPDGNGTHQKINGDIFTGSFKNGLKHGLGQQFFGNGDFYKGQYVNGLPQGFGEYLWKDKSYYKGDFKQGLRVGYGFWCANKNEGAQNYQGHYQMDKKSGYGVYNWENGWSYKGNFENDYRNGYGQLFNTEDVMVYKGYWQDGEKTNGEGMSVMMNTTNNNMTQESFQRSSLISPRRQRSQSKKRYESINFKKHFDRSQNLKQVSGYKIKKRPQSYSNLRQSQAIIHHRSPEKTKEQDETNYGKTSISSTLTKPTVKFNNVYVPWQHSSRLRR